MKARRTHLPADASAAYGRHQPGERGHQPEGVQTFGNQVLHPYQLAVDLHDNDHRGVPRQVRVFSADLIHEPLRPLTQLVGLLPRRWHRTTSSRLETSHQTEPGLLVDALGGRTRLRKWPRKCRQRS